MLRRGGSVVMRRCVETYTWVWAGALLLWEFRPVLVTNGNGGVRWSQQQQQQQQQRQQHGWWRSEVQMPHVMNVLQHLLLTRLCVIVWSGYYWGETEHRATASKKNGLGYDEGWENFCWEKCQILVILVCFGLDDVRRCGWPPWVPLNTFLSIKRSAHHVYTEFWEFRPVWGQNCHNSSFLYQGWRVVSINVYVHMWLCCKWILVSENWDEWWISRQKGRNHALGATFWTTSAQMLANWPHSP